MNSKKSMTNLSIKQDYKKLLERAARDLSVEFDERVTITSIVYALIDGYLDEAVLDVKKKLNFEDK